MDEKLYQFQTTLEMLDELNKTDGIGLASPVTEAILNAAAAHSAAIEAGMRDVAELKILRAGWHETGSGRKARRQLDNPKLLTPYPADRAKALLRERLKLLQEINEAAEPLVSLLLKLELVDGELEAVQLALAEIKADREMHATTGLYAGTAKFVSRLYSRYRIDWRELDGLREEDEEQIAEIIRRRLKPTVNGTVNL